MRKITQVKRDKFIKILPLIRKNSLGRNFPKSHLRKLKIMKIFS